jgi:hypothetical protein
VLAEPAGGWSASVNGHPLTPLAAPVNGWAQGFRLPPGGGMLSVRHSDIGRMVVLGLTGIAVLVVIGLGLPGSRAAAEAAREQEAAAEAARGQEAAAAEDDELATPGRRRAGRGREAEDDELAAPGRRRAGRGRDAEERPLRRRLLRRRKPEPDMPDTEVPDTEVPDTEVPRPAVPAGSFTERVAAVPAGVRGGWPRRGGTSGAEEPHPDDAAPSVVRSHPDSDSYPSGPDRSGAPGPERPVPVGRRRRAGPADLSGEAVSSRAPNGGATGRHSHRAGPDRLAGSGPATDPGRPRQDYGAGSDHDTPGHGHDPAGPGDDAELPRRSHDPAPRGPRFGPRRARRESPPAGPGDYPGGRRAPGRRAAPAPAADAGTGSDGDTHAEHEERERFSLPTRFGRGGRGSPQAPPSQGERPDPAPSQRRGARDGRPAAADGQDTGGYPSGSYDIGNYDIGSSGVGGSRRASQDSGEFAGSSDSGGYPADGYDAGGRGNGSYASGDHDSGYPAGGDDPDGRKSGGYDAAGRGSGGYDAGGRESGGYPAASDDPGQAPGRERRRVRRPSHARATRPGTPPPGGGGQGPQPNGGQADDDAVLSPLPPLPPRTPRRGQWDEPGPRGRDRTAHDDQGDADW